MDNANLTITERLAAQRILPSSDIPPHQFLFNWHGTPCFARGELVAVTGKAKSGKTYLNSILMAVAGIVSENPSPPLKGGRGDSRTENQTLGLQRCRDDPYRVLWLDTEQSEDSTHEILRDRIGTMIHAEPSPDNFAVYNLRAINWQERFGLVKAAILIHEPDLVIFDGIRDIVGDINDYTEAQTVIGDLLSIASYSHACIVCVLHQNKAVEDKTLRGALGTELQNKSFETYECQKDPDTRIFTVRQTATRKYDIAGKQQFCISPEGLPVACYVPEEENKNTPHNSGFNPEYIGPDGRIDKQRLFGTILHQRSLTWMELNAEIVEKANVRSKRFADTLINEARDLKIIKSMVSRDGYKRYGLVYEKELFDETF